MEFTAGPALTHTELTTSHWGLARREMAVTALSSGGRVLSEITTNRKKDSGKEEQGRKIKTAQMQHKSKDIPSR